MSTACENLHKFTYQYYKYIDRPILNFIIVMTAGAMLVWKTKCLYEIL